MTQRRPASRLVYTTDPDDPPAPAEPTPAPPPKQQTARISRDRKGRGGKTVTVISGLQHDPATLEKLLRMLKQHCGAGGTLKGTDLEIQGDHREAVAAKLETLGYKTKLAGG